MNNTTNILTTNKTEAATERFVSSVTQQVSQSLIKRHAKERRFKIAGLLAILFGFVTVVLLMFDITSKALPAFSQHWLEVEVDFNERYLQVTDSSIESLKKANYRNVLKRSLYQMFPDIKGRKDKRSVFKLLSTQAEFQLRNALITRPELINTKTKIWLLADDDVDSYFKSAVELGQPSGRISEKQALWIKTLSQENLVEQRFNTSFFTNGDSREPELAGIKGALTGTMFTMLVCFVISFPLGVAAALYLEEFAPKNRFTDLIEVNINNLAAVPSIVFGLLGLAVIINIFGLPRSAPLVGGIVLSLMTLPTIIIASRASIKAVPPSIREAAIGIGASKMQVALGHVLPLAMPGILTGTIIGLAQALGETAPLLMIGMVAFIVDVPTSITDAATVMPVQIYLWADSPEHAFIAKTSAAILVLLGFLLLMNLMASLLRRKFEKMTK